MLRAAFRRLPPVRNLIAQRDRLAADVEKLRSLPPAAPLRFPPGHFFSPIPDVNQIRARAGRIFAGSREVAAIDMREAAQLELVEQLAAYYADQPFSNDPVEGLRYHFANGFFEWADGLVLHTMLRHHKPGRVVEIGSGHSSALIVDTNRLFLDNAIKLTFIDPDMDRLNSLLSDQDRARVELIESQLQKVDLSLFDRLGPGDFLFVDSSHISRVGSDVHTIFFEILPALKPGVIVHIHDVFHPFEYPQEWIEMGRFFTEAYLARAFLMYNQAFEIRLSNSYLHQFHLERITELMPVWATREGASLWIEKI